MPTPICILVMGRDNCTFITELYHVTMLTNNTHPHPSSALLPNSTAFHTSHPPTTSLCHKPPCQLTMAPPLPLTVYPSHPYLSRGAAMCLGQLHPEDDSQNCLTPQKSSVFGNTAVRTSRHRARLLVTNKVYAALWGTTDHNKWQKLSPVVGCWSEFQFPSLHPHHVNWFVSIHITLQCCRVSFLDCDNSRWRWEVRRCCDTQQYPLLRTYDIHHTAEINCYLQRTV